MIVVDASVFIDLLFEYNSARTHCAEELFSILEEKGFPIMEPDLFKVELTGQIARRVKKELAPKICEEIFQELAFVNTSRIFDEALSIANDCLKSNHNNNKPAPNRERCSHQ